MKCFKHPIEALGVCSYCGRGVCAECVKDSNGARLVCSNACAETLARNEKALELILQKSLQTARASAFYCYLCAALSFGGAIAVYYTAPVPFLIWFAAGCGAVLLTAGIWYSRVARRQP
ncbi:MAG: hypothetical protein ACXWDN_09590 [Limisphaerales bacterium]